LSTVQFDNESAKMVDEKARELSEEVIRNELKASEAMDELVEGYNNGEINDAMEDVLAGLLGNIEDPRRKAAVYQLVFTIGSQIGSEEMARRGKELYEEFVDKHGKG